MNNSKIQLWYHQNYSACDFYRCIFPSIALSEKCPGRVYHTVVPYLEENYYRMCGVVKIHRWSTSSQLDKFTNILLRYKNAYGYSIIYDADDIMFAEDFPQYNIARSYYMNAQVRKAIVNMMTYSDYISVSTEYLRDYYAYKLQIPKNRFIVIKNHIPKWWVGHNYNDLKNVHKKKPIIGFVCGPTHASIDPNIEDDFTNILPWIIDNINNYEFKFVGCLPKQLEKYVDEGKITFIKGWSTINYGWMIGKQGFDIVIAPLKDSVFNRSKSNIKLLEFWASGIPIITSDIPTYSQYHNLTFSDNNQLDNLVNKLIVDLKFYRQIIKDNRSIIDEGDENKDGGWWIDNHYEQFL